MKKQLTNAQFQEAIKDLEVSQKTIEISRGVLVDGKPQTVFVAELGLTRGAVSQVVNRVWAASQQMTPDGMRHITMLLPEHQAFK